MSSSPRRPLPLVVLAGIAVLVLLAWFGLGPESPGEPAPTGQQGGQRVDPETGLAWVALGDLPPEASQTLELIEAGGPFEHEQDGRTFNNVEQLLPEQPRGWYREYTVPTPGSADRGARRVVTGDGATQLFWTEDHYASFARILS